MSDTWIGITKNQPGITTFGTGADEITNAEKFLVYEDGTSYKDIGGIKYAVNENSDVPILMYSFKNKTNEEKKDFWIRAAWIDPTGNIKFYADKNVTCDKFDKDTFEPNISLPMLSGIWTVIVVKVDNNQMLARIPFLVFPSKNISSKIDLSTNNYVSEDVTEFLKTQPFV